MSEKRRFIAGKADNHPLPPVTEALDVDTGLSKLLVVLNREIHNLLIASAAGKLMPEHSRDLVSYLKLLSEVSAEQKQQLAELSDDQLKSIIK